MSEDKTIGISNKAYDRLSWAKKEGESLSDVIIRLTSTKLRRAAAKRRERDPDLR